MRHIIRNANKKKIQLNFRHLSHVAILPVIVVRDALV